MARHILIAVFLLTCVAVLTIAYPPQDANITSLHRRWFGIKAWENQDVDVIPWPVDSWDPAAGSTPVRYCYETEADHDALDPIVQAATKLISPAFEYSTLSIIPDKARKTPKTICKEGSTWIARKDALMISDELGQYASRADVGYDRNIEERVNAGKDGHRLFFKRIKTKLTAKGTPVRVDEDDAVRMAHELSHVIGLDHEQQRPDVRRYVDFHCENLADYAPVKRGIAAKTIKGYREGDSIEKACTDLATANRLHFAASQNIPDPVQGAIGELVYSRDFDFSSITLYGSYDGANGGSASDFPRGAVLVGRQNGQNIRLLMGGKAPRYVTSISEGDIARIAQLYPLTNADKAVDLQRWQKAQSIKNNPKWKQVAAPIPMAGGARP